MCMRVNVCVCVDRVCLRKDRYHSSDEGYVMHTTNDKKILFLFLFPSFCKYESECVVVSYLLRVETRRTCHVTECLSSNNQTYSDKISTDTDWHMNMYDVRQSFFL